jgi:tRNA(fMet)-specific endonuclease VapC
VKYLLDTNTCIGWLRLSQPNLVMRIKQHSPADMTICSIVVSLPFDDAAAEVCGTLRNQLANLGKPIGPNDLLISSIAIANNLTLVTHNTAEFSRVSGLQIEDWQ